jgi:hypothetical protein
LYQVTTVFYNTEELFSTLIGCLFKDKGLEKGVEMALELNLHYFYGFENLAFRTSPFKIFLIKDSISCEGKGF